MTIPPELFQGLPPSVISSLAQLQSAEGKADGKTIVPISDLIPIEDVASRLTLSIASIRAYVKSGRLHPTRPKGRRLMFNPTEVDMELNRIEQERALRKGDSRILGIGQSPKFTSKTASNNSNHEPTVKPSDSIASKVVFYSGEQCAQAVQLFNSGMQPLDVVVEMKVSFATAREFWNEYLSMQRVWVLAHKEFAHIRTLLDWNEEKPTSIGFSVALKKYNERTIETELARRIKREIGEPLTPEEQESVNMLDKQLAEKAAVKKRSQEALALRKKDGE